MFIVIVLLNDVKFRWFSVLFHHHHHHLILLFFVVVYYPYSWRLSVRGKQIHSGRKKTHPTTTTITTHIQTDTHTHYWIKPEENNFTNKSITLIYHQHLALIYFDQKCHFLHSVSFASFSLTLLHTHYWKFVLFSFWNWSTTKLKSGFDNNYHYYYYY